jgi:hypothetical protein
MLRRRTGALGASVVFSLVALVALTSGAPDARADDGFADEAPDAATVDESTVSDEPIPAPMRAPEGPHRAFHPQPKDTTDYVTRRFEPAGFPLIGGDSDIGFEFGVVGTLSYFSDGVKPYRWNMDLILAASVKAGPTGPEIAQQSYLWQIDVPELWGPRVRINPEVAYTHTINYGYFGLGNASNGSPPPTGTQNPDRYYEWIESIAQVRSSMRVQLRGPLSTLFAAQYLYVAPTAYAGSVLARDIASQAPGGGPLIYGTEPVSLPSLAAGFVWDSRDSEIFPRSGMLHEVGVRGERGVPFDSGVKYLEAGGIFRGYVPLGPAVLAARLVTNFQVGNVPFFDLFQAGPFDQKEMPGGSAGIRGVPVGRYLGPIKIIGNVELRSMFVTFSVLKQKFSLGGTVFFDTGRVWSDYSFHSSLDGTGLGLKYGVGGGLYILWGQAAMLRIEAAYSPDAVAENPTLPIGLYVNDGVMF